ncbi:MAG: type IV pilus modification protein PilV [Rhodoferax sp.]|nr:type IV pilus modification protein PilV [Rhodoferax sp.]
MTTSILRRRNKGFALIEILVALVIFAIGLLGTASLQLASLRSSQFTTQAAIATQLARDYAEIVQMLPSAAISASEGTSAFSAVDTSINGPGTVTDCKGSGASCTKPQLAAYMLNEWMARVSTELPGGRAKVCRDSTPKDASGAREGLYHWGCDDQGDMLMIKLGWVARSDKTDKTMQAVADDNRPRIVLTVFGNQKDFTD